MPSQAHRKAPKEYEDIEKPRASIKDPDMNLAPQSGRLIRPGLAGFEVTGDSYV
jgi:hypothetical protein